MRVELHRGKYTLCGGILPPEKIEPGQVWQGSSGATVTVDKVEKRGELHWVTYHWFSDDEFRDHDKDSFSFQCRYCLVLPNENLPDWAKDL